MGITPNYAGFCQTIAAVDLVHRDPERLLLVTKRLYPSVAKQYGVRWKTVERNIRATTHYLWAVNPAGLSRLAGYPLTERPRTAEFISYLACRFRTWQHCNGEPAALALTSDSIVYTLP